MSKIGIHFPNSGFRNLDTLWSIPWDQFVVLDTNRDWVPEIRLRFPRATILVRAYLENWATTDPIGWAHAIALWADELRQFGIELTFANEQNLSAEGHPLGARPGVEYPPASVYQDILRWNLAVIRELRELLPWAALHFPALSQGHSDDEPDAGYVGFEILREAVELCDVLDVHVYWDAGIPDQRTSIHFGERYRLAHRLFPNKPLYVSEVGMFSGAAENGVPAIQWLEALPEYVAGACWFIWDSDSKNRTWVLRDKPAFVHTLRTFAVAHSAPVPAESIFSPVSIAETIVLSMTPFAPARYTLADGKRKVIGFSHVIKPDERLEGTISEDAAMVLLRADLAQCLRDLEQRIEVRLTTNQKAALLSLMFDLGNSDIVGPVLEAVHFSEGLDVTAFTRVLPSASNGNSPESLHRRQIELSLFIRDMIVTGSPQSTARGRPLNLTPVAVHPASVATFIKQGRLYEVVGVWYDSDRTALAGSGELTPGVGNKSGEIAIRVEDENGVGIPAELVVRRWSQRGEDCEAQWSDALGAVRFALDGTSEYSPAMGRGPDRIQVGDCEVSGLGTPIPENGAPMPAHYFIRVRKNGSVA